MSKVVFVPQIQLTFTGRIPSKKNSKRWIQRGSKRFLAPSEEHELWEKEHLIELRGIKPVEPPYAVEVVFYAPDKRRSDATNKAESLFDVLVKAGILVDDNWFVLGDVRLKFGGVDRKKPKSRSDNQWVVRQAK